MRTICVLGVVVLSLQTLSCGGGTVGAAEPPSPPQDPTPGSTTPAILVGSCHGEPDGGTYLFGLGRITRTECVGNFPFVGLPMPSAGTLKNLRIVADIGSTNPDFTLTVVVNGSPTSLTCVLGTNTTCANTTDTMNVGAGDMVGVLMDQTTGGVTNLRVTLEKD